MLIVNHKRSDQQVNTELFSYYSSGLNKLFLVLWFYILHNYLQDFVGSCDSHCPAEAQHSVGADQQVSIQRTCSTAVLQQTHIQWNPVVILLHSAANCPKEQWGSHSDKAIRTKSSADSREGTLTQSTSAMPLPPI